jgi:hypothetical protein
MTDLLLALTIFSVFADIQSGIPVMALFPTRALTVTVVSSLLMTAGLALKSPHLPTLLVPVLFATSQVVMRTAQVLNRATKALPLFR